MNLNKIKVRHLLEGVFDHGGYEPREVRTRELKARIGVDLDHPSVQVLIYHEVVAEELKLVFSSIRINLSFHREKSVNNYIFHAWHQICIHIYINLFLVEVSLEVGITQSVAIFVLPICNLIFHL